MSALRATARLQFHKDFTLDHALDLVPYFRDLGISHVYASPLLKSRPGSTHGYDIVDHHAIDPELGGEPALRRLVEELRRHEMGLILDIVPNHMGVGGADNAWWLDVLEWGRASPYAEYFDIDWEPPDATLRGRLLAPFLGNAYGEALEAGDLVLKFDAEDGRFYVSAYDTHRFPIDPRHTPRCSGREGRLSTTSHPDSMRSVPASAGARGCATARGRPGRCFAGLPRERSGAIEAVLRAFAVDDPEGRDRLHRLLERQNYRLAWWRAAADEINWRRFFDINSLAGIRAEQPNVFDDTHAFVLGLYAEGLIDGVRIDHVDGLADPRGYCRKLRRRLEVGGRVSPEDSPARPRGDLGREDPGPGRAPADRLADGRHDRLRLHERCRRASARSGRGSAAYRALVRAHRPARRLRGGSAGGAAADPAREPVQRTLRHRRCSAPHCAAGPPDPRLHADRRAQGARGVAGPLPGLPDLRGHRRHLGDGRAPCSRPRCRVRVAACGLPTSPCSNSSAAGYQGRGCGRPLPARDGTSGYARWCVSSSFRRQRPPSRSRTPPSTATAAYSRATRSAPSRRGSPFPRRPSTPPTGNAGGDYPRALLATATHDHKRGEDTRMRLAVLSEIPDEWESCARSLDAAERAHEAGGREPARAGRSRRDHALPDDRRRMAARASPRRHRKPGRLPRPDRGVAGEGAARGEAPYELGCPEC